MIAALLVDTHPAPRLGQHSREILRETGFRDDEIAHLLAGKIAIEAGQM